MRINKISVYQKTLPYVGGVYCWGDNNPLRDADSTVVVVSTDSGVDGCGECCTLGRTYLSAYPEGVRAAIGVLAPALLGEDPRHIGRIAQVMDATLKGHHYAKAPIDSACWDILGKHCNAPVWMLMGGRLCKRLPMYRVAPIKPLEETKAEMADIRRRGYRQFQIKVGGDWREDIERIRVITALLQPGETAYADANTGWRVDEAVRVCRAVRDCDVIIEQPCLTYAECLQVRRRTDLPMKLDECIDSLAAAQQAVADNAAEIICVKVSKQGGLSRAKKLRDFLLAHRVPMVVEDSWGGEIATAAYAHLAASTPAQFMLATTDLHNYVTGTTGTPPPATTAGTLIAPDTPGLGVAPDYDSLGTPVAVYG